jgi:4-hydroxybenzoate polyprenyltransferase/phosphoserine phosphatase
MRNISLRKWGSVLSRSTDEQFTSDFCLCYCFRPPLPDLVNPFAAAMFLARVVVTVVNYAQFSATGIPNGMISGESTAELGNAAVPLCVDLDGTLIKTDLLWEYFALLIKQSPWLLLLVPFWALRGRSYLKHRLASRLEMQVEMLPYREEVLRFLRAERENGRRIVLVTAANQGVAEHVAAHIGIFDEVHGSTVDLNLKGAEKAEWLSRNFGVGGFEYVGDSEADLPAWRAASGIYVVGSRNFLRKAERAGKVRGFFEVSSPSFPAWIRSLRLHHWSKNLLVFLPVMLAHKLAWNPWREAVVGFFLFGTCASGLYILNDLLDLHSDRQHPWKNKRPFASGELPLWVGIIESTVLVGGSLAISVLVAPKLALVLGAYSVLTILYSWQIKKIALLDVFLLSGFYSFRIWAGGLVSGTPLSSWFIAFSVFFFLSLAIAKRNSELIHADQLVNEGQSGRGYLLGDRATLAMMGIGSCFAAVVILALYAHSPEVTALYRAPERLIFLCPIVLYWLSRVWLKASRGELNTDPVTFALRDGTSWILAAIAAAVLLLSNVQFR